MSQAESHMTIDHDEIRRWCEKRKGAPSAVIRTAGKRGSAGIIRIDFPGYTGEGDLEEITWDEFFDQFEKSKLAFIYQEKTADGKRSNFNKLVKRPARMKSAGTVSKSGARKPAQSRSKSPAKTSGKTAKAPAKAKTKTSRGQSKSKSTAKPKTATKAKTASKPAAKRKSASRSSNRVNSKIAAKPQSKTKSQSRTRSQSKTSSRVKPKATAKAKTRTKAEAR